MKKSIIITLGLVVIFALIASIAAARMITVANYMNSASHYAAAHSNELAIPQPIIGAKVINPQLKVSTDAYYGDAVEVQIVRRYQSIQNLEQDFMVTYFYLPSSNGWKTTTPPTNFWGDTETLQANTVTVIFPKRNTKLVDNLLKAIDPLITATCSRWGCTADLKPVTITFITDPAAQRAPLTFLAPQLTGVPMSKQANDDYFSNIASESLLYIAQKIGFYSPYARAFAYREIQKQNLYADIPNIKSLTNTTLPRPSEVWAINADRSALADSVAFSFLNFALSKNSVNETDALKALSGSASFNEWIAKAKLGEPAALEAEWSKTLK